MGKTLNAVILAAGIGARLNGTFHNNKPKGFLQLGEKTIIEDSLNKLHHCGITDILIVTGYKQGYYDQLAEKYPFARTTRNSEFATTGSMHSLAIAAEFIHSRFLLLESDLIYECKALWAVQNSSFDNCILLSGKTNSGDEVYVQGTDNRVTFISKIKNDTEELAGELVGISMISLDLYHRMVNHFWGQSKRNRRYDYENCMSDLSKTVTINYECISDLIWAEIDDKRQLIRAQKEVYPLIQETDVQFFDSPQADRNVSSSQIRRHQLDLGKHDAWKQCKQMCEEIHDTNTAESATIATVLHDDQAMHREQDL